MPLIIKNNLKIFLKKLLTNVNMLRNI